jgi:hypothetical protein
MPLSLLAGMLALAWGLLSLIGWLTWRRRFARAGFFFSLVSGIAFFQWGVYGVVSLATVALVAFSMVALGIV